MSQLSLQRVRARIATINARLREDLPVLPKIVSEISEATRDDSSAAEDLADIILKDQTLTARVLRMINSVPYHRRVKATTISQAVILIGFDAIRNLAISIALYGMLDRKSESLTMLYRHSLTVAVLCRILAERIAYPEPEEALIAGLIHDIGRLVLVKYFPEEYKRIESQVSAGKSRTEAEVEVIGANHAQIGEEILSEWKLAETLRNATGSHHTLTRHREVLANVVKLANVMAHEIWSDEIQSVKSIDFAHQVLTLRPTDLEWAREELQVRFKEYAKIFESDASELEDDDAAKAQRVADQKALELDCLADISRVMVSGASRDHIMTTICEGAFRGIGFDRVMLMFIDEKRKELVVRHAAGAGSDGMINLRFPANVGVIGKCVKERRTERVNASGEKARPQEPSDPIKAVESRDFVCVPIISGGQGVGAFVVDNGLSRRPVTDDALISLQTFANQVAIAMVMSPIRVPPKG